MEITKHVRWDIRVGLFVLVSTVGIVATILLCRGMGASVAEQARMSAGRSSASDIIYLVLMTLGVVSSLTFACTFLWKRHRRFIGGFRCLEPGCKAPVAKTGSMMSRCTYRCGKGHEFEQ
jgi:hypothetical protein